MPVSGVVPAGLLGKNCEGDLELEVPGAGDGLPGPARLVRVGKAQRPLREPPVPLALKPQRQQQRVCRSAGVGTEQYSACHRNIQAATEQVGLGTAKSARSGQYRGRWSGG